MNTGIVSSGGAKLRVHHQGEGPAVVFLHAGVADLRMWRAQFEALAPRFRVLAYDRRGFGESVAPDEEFSQVGDLEALLDVFELKNVVLVGCSQGGRVAIDFALAHPERVRKMFLAAPAVSGDDEDAFPHSDVVLSLAAQIESAEEAGDTERLNALEALAWLDGPAGPEGRVGGKMRDLFLEMNRIALGQPEWTRELEPLTAMTELGRLQLPIQLIWGDLDFPYIADRCRRLSELLPNASSFCLKRAAHLTPMERPIEFNECLLGFLSRDMH